MADAASPRRGFIRRLIAGAAGLTTASAVPDLLGAADDDWMKTLTAPHRTVFDVSAHKNGKPLGHAKNYLDGWRDAFHTPEHNVNLVMGIHGEAAPFLLSDPVWDRYRIGQQYDITDGETKTAATRNVFISAHAAPAALVTSDQTIEALQQRGVRFIICMNTIASTTRKFVAAGLGSYDEIHAAILAGLLPGVITVPAITVALTQLQEHGLKYEKVE